MRDLRGLSAVVTGASSGVGCAIAHALAQSGVRVLLSGRDEGRLSAACRALPDVGLPHQFVTGDIASGDDLRHLVDAAIALGDGISVFVSSAGAHELHSVLRTPTEALDRMLNVNLRAPYVLVRELLPEIIRVQGQIVFINSSVVENPRAHAAAYAASKAGLRAFANCLRAEVNAAGVRVLSVYPGRTATPLQAEVYAREGREYRPELLLQPEDIAQSVLGALTLPITAEVTDLHVRPNIKS